MKKLLSIAILAAGLVTTAFAQRNDRVIVDRDGRVITTDGRANRDNLPPGQAKKVYGSKSAKPYAPGQRKKQGNIDNTNLPPIIGKRRDQDDRDYSYGNGSAKGKGQGKNKKWKNK